MFVLRRRLWFVILNVLKVLDVCQQDGLMQAHTLLKVHHCVLKKHLPLLFFTSVGNVPLISKPSRRRQLQLLHAEGDL